MERKFNQYIAVSSALRRAGVENYGICASLLLETFLEDGGRLPASKASARGLCKDGEFWLWRKTLVEKNWLVWSESQQDKGQYFPGKKLLPYINKEKIISKELVTKDEVPTKDEFQELKARVNRMEEAISELNKTYEPPETDEKRLARERAASKLAQLAKAN